MSMTVPGPSRVASQNRKLGGQSLLSGRYGLPVDLEPPLHRARPEPCMRAAPAHLPAGADGSVWQLPPLTELPIAQPAQRRSGSMIAMRESEGLGSGGESGDTTDDYVEGGNA
jgi:hypothetical protein